jgi:hypothetical protein
MEISEFKASLTTDVVLDAAQREISDFETFVAGDGNLSIRMREGRTLPKTAQDVLDAVAPLIAARALEEVADYLQDGEPTTPALIGPHGLQDIADDLREGGA